MRLDHIAYRVKDREKTTSFFIECFGYRIPKDLPDGFTIQFEDGTKAKCYALIPPEKRIETAPWNYLHPLNDTSINYHLAPEIFVSEGTPGSIVESWVNARNGVGGIHHLAYQVDSVQNKMNEWREKGYAEFTTEDPLTCPGLVQAFTQPSEITGVIYEFIEREGHGFCETNVRDLMESTKDL